MNDGALGIADVLGGCAEGIGATGGVAVATGGKGGRPGMPLGALGADGIGAAGACGVSIGAGVGVAGVTCKGIGGFAGRIESGGVIRGCIGAGVCCGVNGWENAGCERWCFTISASCTTARAIFSF